jgi:hypothetical protein
MHGENLAYEVPKQVRHDVSFIVSNYFFSPVLCPHSTPPCIHALQVYIFLFALYSYEVAALRSQ